MNYTENNNIFITRGDTGAFHVTLKDRDGEPFIPEAGYTLRFAMARKYDAGKDILIDKEFPAEDAVIEIDPIDTKYLKFGNYVYDVELRDASDNYVDTVISARMVLLKEV